MEKLTKGGGGEGGGEGGKERGRKGGGEFPDFMM